MEAKKICTISAFLFAFTYHVSRRGLKSGKTYGWTLPLAVWLVNIFSKHSEAANIDPNIHELQLGQ